MCSVLESHTAENPNQTEMAGANYAASSGENGSRGNEVTQFRQAKR
jgi:hypothetical protein